MYLTEATLAKAPNEALGQNRDRNTAELAIDGRLSCDEPTARHTPAWALGLRFFVAGHRTSICKPPELSMKTMVAIASFAALFLFVGSSNALSQDTAVEQTSQAGSPQTTAPSVPVQKHPKPENLPEAPQAIPANSGGLLFPFNADPLYPQTFHDKFMTYAVGTVGPRALFLPAIPAALRMAKPLTNYPPEWRQGFQAFGRNYGDQLSTKTAFQTARFAAGAALREDLRYHRSNCTNYFARTSHALVFTFFDKSDDGHTHLALANFAGVAAGGYVGMSYLPQGFNDITHADQRVAIRLSGISVRNIGAEFAPDLAHFAMRHHLPHLNPPIPEWWTKQ
jgi:hypothetical protein